MQSWILDFDLKKSAHYLDRQRLGANIYENIHGLASLLGLNKNLYTPKRTVANHSNIKIWKGYEKFYLEYIKIHLNEWINRGYQSKINFINYKMLKIKLSELHIDYKYPVHIINDVTIKNHKNRLLEKDFNYYKNIFNIEGLIMVI